MTKLFFDFGRDRYEKDSWAQLLRLMPWLPEQVPPRPEPDHEYVPYNGMCFACGKGREAHQEKP